jgi:hypothetical protein
VEEMPSRTFIAREEKFAPGFRCQPGSHEWLMQLVISSSSILKILGL